MAKKQLVRKKSVRPVKQEERVSSYDQWIVWLCLTILVVVPLIFSRISYDQFDLVKLAIFRVLVLGIVFIYAAKSLKKAEPINWSWREGLLLAFLVVGIISTFTSIHIPTSLHGKYKRYEGLLTFITYITAYFIATQIFKTKKQIKTLIEVISLTGAAVAFYGILQYVGLDPIGWGTVPFEERRSFSTFGNPDLLAGYLAIAFPCAIVAFLDKSKRFWIHGLSVFLLATCLLTAFTRSGWLGAVVGTILTVVLLGRRLVADWKKAVAILATVIMVVMALTVYSAGHPGLNLTNKFISAFTGSGGTAMSRFNIWLAGWTMVKDRPFFGQGLDTYRLASEHFETKWYVQSTAGGTVSDNAHNYFVQLAAGGGPLAALLMYGFFFAWIYRMIKVRRGVKDDPDSIFIIGSIGAVTGYLATMLLGISIVGASSTFWLLMGAMVGYTRNMQPSYRVFDAGALSQELKLATSLILIVLTVISAAFAVMMYVGDIYFVKALVAAAQFNEAGAVSKFSTAATLYPGNGRIMSELGQAYTRWARDALQRQDQKSFKYYGEKAVVAFERARAAEMPEIDYQVFLANTHGYLGQYDQAVEQLRRVVRYRPYSVPGNLLLGQFTERKGQAGEAIRHYEAVVEIVPTNDEALSSLARLYKEIGNDERAAYYEKLARPTSPGTATP